MWNGRKSCKARPVVNGINDERVQARVVAEEGTAIVDMGLVCQGLICTEQQADAGAFAQLRQ